MLLEATKKFKWPVWKYVSVPILPYICNIYNLYSAYIPEGCEVAYDKKKKEPHMSNSTVKNSQKGKSETI